jgi:hypothetical protein
MPSGWSLDPDGNIGARWMVTAPRGAQNSAYRFTCPKIFFRGLYVAKHKGEAQALTKGLSKVEQGRRWRPSGHD